MEKGLTAEIRKAERDLTARLTAFASALKTENGRILDTVRNVTFTGRLSRVFTSFTNDNREAGLAKWLIAAVNKLLGANRRYFTTMARNGPHSEAARAFLETLGVRDGQVIRGGWLDTVLSFGTIRANVFQRMQTAVLSRMSFRSLVTGIGKLVRGSLSRILGRGDFFIRGDRGIQNFYAEKLDLQHALFSGTIKDTTRPFCRARNQFVYTRKEIDSWNALDWDGKIPNADVKVVLGGYGPCRHHLNWVTPDVAEVLGPINEYR